MDELTDANLKIMIFLQDIDEVMTNDNHDNITREQILLMGKLADGVVPDAILTTKTLIELIDKMELGDPISHDQIKIVGGTVIMAMKK